MKTGEIIYMLTLTRNIGGNIIGDNNILIIAYYTECYFDRIKCASFITFNMTVFVCIHIEFMYNKTTF